MDEAIRQLVFSRPIPARLIESIAIAPVVPPYKIEMWSRCGGRITNLTKRSRPGHKQPHVHLPPERLARRELKCLQLKAEGLTNKEAAYELGINYRTFEMSLAQVRFRLGANTNEHAILIAVAKGIIRPAGIHKVDIPPATLETLPESLHKVLILICEGYENPEIAQQLGITTDTIKGYVKALLRIFHARNRTQLAVFAVGGKIV